MDQVRVPGVEVSRKDGTLLKVGSANKVGQVGTLNSSLGRSARLRRIVLWVRATGSVETGNGIVDRVRLLLAGAAYSNQQNPKEKSANATRLWIQTQPKTKKLESALYFPGAPLSGHAGLNLKITPIGDRVRASRTVLVSPS